ncbi:hypothetical protein [Spiroplasma endosymbiont of Panorpa germanica]|uniref:hypothetical protein n=1 Tax=Spiroplasma endosymbiont of Panorpa germanica TaxID=3066314 RepID=UPI0030CF863F
MKKTNNDKNFGEFLNEIGITWFRDNLGIKIEKLKKDFLELTNGENNENNPLIDNASAIMIKPQAIDSVYKKFQDVSQSWDTIQDIKNYTISNNNIFDLTKIFSEQNSINNSDLISEMIDGDLDISEVIVKVQIETIIKMLSNSLDLIDDILSKLGPNTQLKEIDTEDLEYVLDVSIKKSIDNFEKWIEMNYREFENFKEEFLILKDEKVTLEKRLEKADVISLFFKQFKSKEIAKDIEEIDLNNDQGFTKNTAEKFINFTNGAQIVGDIKSRIKIAILIKNKF